jgi:hypothetical protein
MVANVGKSVRAAAQVIALAVLVLAVACVVSLEARSPVAPPVPQTETISVSSTVDRTSKRDRLPVLSPAAERKVLPGCERPFSPLAKGPPQLFSGRCVT